MLWRYDMNYGKRFKIINPYENVNWSTVNHVKSALHTHTSNSGIVWNDGEIADPETLITAYQNSGFDALVITDHDYVSYPWINGNVVSPPSNVNFSSFLLTTPGNELSKSVDLLSYGTRYMDKYDPSFIKNQRLSEGYDQNIINVAKTLNIYGKIGGIIYLPHPIRNDTNETHKDSPVTQPYSDLWWLSKFDFKNVKGIEVFNCGLFSKNHSERLWDSLLSKSMPQRFIFGTASDDNHGDTSYSAVTSLGTGWTNVLIAPSDMNSKGLFDSLSTGRTYFSTYMIVNSLNGDNDDKKPRPLIPQPKVYSVKVDNALGTITLITDYAYKVEWISGVNNNNTISKVIKTDFNTGGGSSAVHFTSTINVENLNVLTIKGYVRVRIIGDGGQTHLQPFGIKPLISEN